MPRIIIDQDKLELWCDYFEEGNEFEYSGFLRDFFEKMLNIDKEWNENYTEYMIEMSKRKLAEFRSDLLDAYEEIVKIGDFED